MWNNCLWFIEQAWITLFKAFVIKICTAYFDFTNLPLKYSILKRGHIFFLLSLCVLLCCSLWSQYKEVFQYYFFILLHYTTPEYFNTEHKLTFTIQVKRNFFYHQLLWKLCSNRFSSEERTASQVSHCLFLACNPLRRTT